MYRHTSIIYHLSIVYRISMSISRQQIILVIITVIIVVILSRPSYFRAINQLYTSFSRLPRLLFIMIGVLSLLGLSHTIDPSYFLHSILRIGKSTGTSPVVSGRMSFDDDNHKRLVSETTKNMLRSKQNWTCGLCHRPLDETFEVDHVIPLYKGGSNQIENLMALDPICHRKKTNADRLEVSVETFLSQPTCLEIIRHVVMLSCCHVMSCCHVSSLNGMTFLTKFFLCVILRGHVYPLSNVLIF